MINVQWSWLGSVKIVYLPAGPALPCTTRSALETNVVASLAPARHTSPYGTNLPKILRPLMRGLEKATLIALPSANVQPVSVRGLGSWLFGRHRPGAAGTSTARRTAVEKAMKYVRVFPLDEPL